MHEIYIKRCIQLAKNGLGTTYTNPMVGSVIVHNDRIIGEGWHQKAGEAHAEVHAINSVKNKDLLKESTIYVSLEPCSHFGKTPPCSDLIIQYGIPNIVIGAVDSFAKVAGRGIQKLKNAGRNVTVGVLEKECLELNKRFFTFHTKKRPYIILKWAQSHDGFIAPNMDTILDRKPIWITNPQSRQLVHKWRAEEQSILVGTNTVIKDNPKLTIRDWSGINPTRIVLDQQERIPKDSFIFDQSAPTIIITKEGAYNDFNATNIRIKNIDFSINPISQICAILHKEEIQSIIIEGGTQTITSFIQTNLWDEARVFTGTSIIKDGVKAPTLKSTSFNSSSIFTDILTTYYND